MNSIALYEQQLNLHDAVFTRIDHDDAMVAVVYKITQPNTDPLILKICTRTKDYLREVYFLNHFADKISVPRIIQVVEPQKSLKGAVLMECLPGTLLKAEDLTDILAYEIGSQLARIHLHRLEGYGDIFLPNNLSTDPRIYFSRKFDEHFNECINHLPKKLLTECHSYYDTHLDLLASADGPCAVHRDFRPGNLMVLEDKLQGIIDWAAGEVGFAEEDFCPIEHGEWLGCPSNKKSFLAGYASIRPVPDYHALMPLLRLNKALGIIGFTVKQNTWNESHAKIYQFNLRFLEIFFPT